MFILPSGPQKSPTVNKSSATQHVIHTYEWLLSDSQRLKADLRSSEARAGCKWIHLHSDQKKYISVSSGLFPSTLYDPTPTHPILAPLLPTPHFLSHQVMTSGFELGSLRVLFSEFSPPSSGISPILGLQQRSQGACLISSRSIFISPSHSPSLRKIQTARFSFKVKNWQSP